MCVFSGMLFCGLKKAECFCKDYKERQKKFLYFNFTAFCLCCRFESLMQLRILKTVFVVYIYDEISVRAVHWTLCLIYYDNWWSPGNIWADGANVQVLDVTFKTYKGPGVDYKSQVTALFFRFCLNQILSKSVPNKTHSTNFFLCLNH